MPEQQPENIIDQFFKFLQQLLLPNWSDLILLLAMFVLLWVLLIVRLPEVECQVILCIDPRLLA